MLYNPTYSQASHLRAELTGSDTATAAGIVAAGGSPVLALCRKLIQAGLDPATPLHCYRGKTLCLAVRSIGEAAGLEVNGHGTGFKTLHKGGAADSVRFDRLPYGEAAE